MNTELDEALRQLKEVVRRNDLKASRNRPASGVSFTDGGGGLGGGEIDMQAVIEAILTGLLGAYLTVIGGGKGNVQDHGTLGATETLDLANGNYHHGELDEDCAISTTGWTNFKDCQITVEVTGDGTSTPTFSGVTWIGTAPGVIGSGDVILVVLVSRDGGTTIYGAVVGGSSIADILDLPTAEMDDTLVLAPDGAGGVEFRAETGGGGGGGLVLLEQHTASASATLDFTTFISGTYDTYRFELVDVLPATDAVVLWMRMGTGGGPTFDTGTNYGFGMIRYNAAGAAGSGTTSGATKIELTNSTDVMSNDATYNGCSGDITLTTPGSATYKKVRGQIAHKSTNWGAVDTTGIYLSTTAVTAVQFLMSSGNIASGTIRVYGLAK